MRQLALDIPLSDQATDEREKIMHSHQLIGSAARAFALAGNARFTIVSKATGVRFTYRVRASKPSGNERIIHFVSVLTGSDNDSDFTYLGTIFQGEFKHGSKSAIGPDAPSARAFTWAWPRLAREVATMEVWHEGQCCRCGRTLTVPESIRSGWGPECIKHQGGSRAA